MLLREKDLPETRRVICGGGEVWVLSSDRFAHTWVTEDMEPDGLRVRHAGSRWCLARGHGGTGTGGGSCGRLRRTTRTGTCAAEGDVDAEHIALADADGVEGLRGALKELVVIDELLSFGGNAGFAFDDGFEKLDGHVTSDFQGDDVGVGLLRADNAYGDPPG